MKKTKKVGKASNAPSAAKADISSRIKPVSESFGWISALFYGRSGTGKTTLASSFPKPVLFIDLREEGTDSVADVEGAHVLACETWEDVEQAYWYLQQNPGKYQTVVLDTVTQMQDFAMAEVKEREGRGPEDPMTQQLWGHISGLVKQWAMAFRDLPIHTVFLAQDRENKVDDEDDEQIQPTVGPAVMPSIAKTINAAVKILGYTFIKEVNKQKGAKIITKMEYHLRVGPHPNYITKIRSPKSFRVPSTVLNPSYDKLVSIMKGEKTNNGEEE